MTTKHYHQWKHHKEAMRKFDKVRGNWFPRGKGKWECKNCLFLATSLKKVFEHHCTGKNIPAPVVETGTAVPGVDTA